MINIKELATDKNHWIGWILSTVGIIGVFNYFGIIVYQPFYILIILLLTIVIIDIFKHVVKLQ